MDKKNFFDNLIALLKENNATLTIKVDGKNNNYIGFKFPDASYCCNIPEELDPNNVVFECEEKFNVSDNGGFQDFPVENSDHFSYSK